MNGNTLVSFLLSQGGRVRALEVMHTHACTGTCVHTQKPAVLTEASQDPFPKSARSDEAPGAARAQN